jgi:hypothetical protein
MNDKHKYWLIKWFAEIQTATHFDTIAHYNAMSVGYLNALEVCQVITSLDFDTEVAIVVAACNQRYEQLKAKK